MSSQRAGGGQSGGGSERKREREQEFDVFTLRLPLCLLSGAATVNSQ